MFLVEPLEMETWIPYIEESRMIIEGDISGIIICDVDLKKICANLI